MTTTFPSQGATNSLGWAPLTRLGNLKNCRNAIQKKITAAVINNFIQNKPSACLSQNTTKPKMSVVMIIKPLPSL
jgi:hypothetical protein